MADGSPRQVEGFIEGRIQWRINAVWFEFREDSTYKFVNGSGLGATYIRGKYQLQGNHIILDTNNLDGAVKTKYLMIRTQEQEDFRRNTRSRLPEMMLYQVDSNNNIVDRDFAFVVHEDHRKPQ